MTETAEERRLFHGPDDALRLWRSLVEREETPAGRDPFLIKGRKAAKACANCRRKRHHVVPAKRGQGWIDRCMRCGAAWRWDTKYVMRGEVRVSRRPHELERRLVNLHDLEHAIDQLPDLERFIYGVYVLKDLTYEHVVEKATELALEHPDQCTMPVGGITLSKVIYRVQRARCLLVESLAARGLMARSVPVLMKDGRREAVDVVEPLPVDVVVPADPARWSGLLQDLEILPEAVYGRVSRSAATRLSRGTTAQLGIVYREVPLWTDRP